jgi:hypothetical protein
MSRWYNELPPAGVAGVIRTGDLRFDEWEQSFVRRLLVLPEAERQQEIDQAIDEMLNSIKRQASATPDYIAANTAALERTKKRIIMKLKESEIPA